MCVRSGKVSVLKQQSVHPLHLIMIWQGSSCGHAGFSVLMQGVVQRSELQAKELQTLTEEKRVLLEYAVAMQRKVRSMVLNNTMPGWLGGLYAVMHFSEARQRVSLVGECPA